MTLPRQIPAGARVVVRITDGIDPGDHRMKFRDYVGHVVSWTDTRWRWCVTPPPMVRARPRT